MAGPAAARQQTPAPSTAVAGAAASGRTGAASYGRVALGLLLLVYLLLAALPAAPGSRLVLATVGGSPDWLLGPLGFLGLDGANGPLAGPLFFGGLWVALLLYIVVLVRARDIPVRVAIGAITALHLVFLLAPPLLSQDVFSYISYARLGVEHGLDPYTSAPLAVPGDPVFGFAGSILAVSAYGPLFTLLTYPLALVGVPVAFWALKVMAAAASLGVVGIVWRIARRLGRDPLVPALLVGLNPHVLVHVVAGAHNEALMVLVTMAGVLLFVTGRPAASAGVATAAAGLKASAGLVVPFLVLGARRAGGSRGVLRAAGAAAVAALLIAVVAVLGFGADALDALGLIGSNQRRTSSMSIPYRTAQFLGAVLPGDRLDYRSAVRVAYALGFAAVAGWLLWRTWRGADPIAMAGWTTFAILIATAWLVPWYLLWLLPLAALAADRRLVIATVALSAWALAIAVPL